MRDSDKCKIRSVRRLCVDWKQFFIWFRNMETYRK